MITASEVSKKPGAVHVRLRQSGCPQASEGFRSPPQGHSDGHHPHPEASEGDESDGFNRFRNRD